jgi:hypothetical protein
MLLFIMKNCPNFFTNYYYYLNEIRFILKSPNLHILTNFNYVLTKYKHNQIFTNIFFNVHYIKSEANQ